MIDDPDIFRAAKLLTDQHAADAPIRAAQRADQLFDEGDVDGAMVWRRILEAIVELQRERKEDEALNCGTAAGYFVTDPETAL